MPPIQQIGATNDAGIGIYYVPPGEQPPNAFASFWSNFLAARAPSAMAAFKARMAAMSPQAQYEALGAMSRSTEGLVRSFGEIEKETLGNESSERIEGSQATSRYWDGLVRNRVAELGASAQVSAARIGLESDRIKAGVLDRPAQEIAGEFSARMSGLQEQLNRATMAGDGGRVEQITGDIERTIANAKAKANAAGITGPQYDSLARTLGSIPMVLQDAESQNELRRTIEGTFGRPGEVQIDLPGAGGSALPSMDQLYRPTGRSPGAVGGAPPSKSRAMAEQMLGPAPSSRSTPSAGPPEPTPERRTGPPGTSPASGGVGSRSASPSSGSPAPGRAPSPAGAGPVRPPEAEPEDASPPARSEDSTSARGTAPRAGGPTIPTGSPTQDLALQQIAANMEAQRGIRADLATRDTDLGGFRDPLPGYRKEPREGMPRMGGGRGMTERADRPERGGGDREEKPSKSRAMAERLFQRKPKALPPSDLDHALDNFKVPTGGGATQVTEQKKPEGRTVSKVGPGSRRAGPASTSPSTSRAPSGSRGPSGSTGTAPLLDEPGPRQSRPEFGDVRRSEGLPGPMRPDPGGGAGDVKSTEAKMPIPAEPVKRRSSDEVEAMTNAAAVRSPAVDDAMSGALDAGIRGSKALYEKEKALVGSAGQAMLNALPPDAPVLQALAEYRKKRAAAAAQK